MYTSFKQLVGRFLSPKCWLATVVQPQYIHEFAATKESSIMVPKYQVKLRKVSGRPQICHPCITQL